MCASALPSPTPGPRPASRGEDRGPPCGRLLLLGLALGACTARPAHKSVQPSSSSAPVPDDSGSAAGPTVPAGTAVLVDSELRDALLQALASAESRVRVAQYTLWDSGDAARVHAAVAEAAARGVDVQVLADEEAGDTPDVLAQLERAGAETRLDSPETTLHTKLWVIDDVAFTGSHNLSDSALSSNREVSARLTDPTAVAAVDGWFSALWTDSTARVTAPAVDGSTRPVFDDDVLPAILACIDGATERVRVAHYAFAWSADYPGGEVDQVLQAFVAAHHRGVDVRLLLDGSAWITDHDINTDALAQLRAAGVPVRVAASGELVHAKAMVCDATAFVSDANWSYSGLALYHGASVSLDSERLADDLASWIDDLYAAGRE